MKYKLFILSMLALTTGKGQELFVFTEPASNMATKSIGARLNNYIMPETFGTKVDYHLIPEIMAGVSKNVMVHADLFLSNRPRNLKYEGESVYIKYRFYTNDEVQRHFRLAAFSRLSINNSDIHQEEINLYGYNTGLDVGIVATQLLHKVALSSAVSFVKAYDNRNNNKFLYGMANSKALNYTLSFGKLMLPKEYTNYKQTNLNIMIEFLNQYNLGSGKYYMDVAPAVQLIMNSVARIDIGYRKQLSSTLFRPAPNGLFVRLEYNFFNVY